MSVAGVGAGVVMASLASKFNASARLVTMDLFRACDRNASGRSEVVVGRIATAVIVVMGICWVLVIKSLHCDRYVYRQSVPGYLSAAIAVLLLLGVFCKRANAPAALSAFFFARLPADLPMRNNGVIFAVLKQQHCHQAMSLDQYNAGIEPLRATHGWIFDFWNMLYYTQRLLVVSAVLTFVIRLLAKAPDPRVLKFTCYGASLEEKAASRASWGASDVVLSPDRAGGRGVVLHRLAVMG